MDWLDEELGEFENDYLLIDCPGKHVIYEKFLPSAAFLATL